MPRTRKIAVDFDGVASNYTKWIAPHVIPDEPTSGFVEWINKIRYAAGIEVFMFTTRAQTYEGIRAVQRWMLQHGVIDAERMIVTDRKLPADMYIDDRGYRFTGDNWPSIEEIEAFERWGFPKANSPTESAAL